MFTKDESLSVSINHKGFCRTAPATPGLFKNLKKVYAMYQIFLLLLSTLVKEIKLKKIVLFNLPIELGTIGVTIILGELPKIPKLDEIYLALFTMFLLLS